MGSASNYLENKILDHIFGGGDFARPGTLYIALCTAAPTDASIGSTLVEATYTGYARKAITNDEVQFPPAAGGSKSNANTILFAKCTGSTSAITHFAITDDPDVGEGNVLAWGALNAQLDVETGDIPTFLAGELAITMD